MPQEAGFNTPFDEESCPWSLDEDRRLLHDVVKEAGRIALDFFNKTSLVKWEKGENDPVSEADLAVDKFLQTALGENRTGYGWLSEESEDNPDRLRCGRLWVVDPIDGTRAFIKGHDDWGISVALVQDGKPVLAAFYAPVREDFFFAEAGKGATLNGGPICVSTQANIADARMMGDPSGFTSQYWPVKWPKSMECVPANSIALRLCVIAAGGADACVTLRPKNDWDIAAADLILREAGGTLETGDGNGFIYNKKKPLHAHIVASNTHLQQSLEDRVRPALKAWRDRQAAEKAANEAADQK